ncbi:hypothetical protein CMQ_5055 [Grosmannia clavigera kw1407]|uniref:Uncharacterized protein n=1 Tax=Grosmannia clavigera (strain kw1407 / UAMH 11150) TaxID=655863 RepID=F0XK03_GROCL|nr:uncharacterized protein CMQ_5055 [Grosmannia clavigera kw1407]EFX01984.1 hypothetical protein CMQ_5055 [Grosmannia clavigera kw1407]
MYPFGSGPSPGPYGSGGDYNPRTAESLEGEIALLRSLLALQTSSSSSSDWISDWERTRSPRPGLNSFGSPYRLPQRPFNAPLRYCARTHRNPRGLEVPENTLPHGVPPPPQPAAYRQAPSLMRQESARNWTEILRSSNIARQDSPPIYPTIGPFASQLPNVFTDRLPVFDMTGAFSGTLPETYTRRQALSSFSTEGGNIDYCPAKSGLAKSAPAEASSRHSTVLDMNDMNEAHLPKELRSLRDAARNAGIRVGLKNETPDQSGRSSPLSGKNKSVLDPSSSPFKPTNTAPGKANMVAKASAGVLHAAENHISGEVDARRFATPSPLRNVMSFSDAPLDGIISENASGSIENFEAGRYASFFPAASTTTLDVYKAHSETPYNMAGSGSDPVESSRANEARTCLSAESSQEEDHDDDDQEDCQYFLPPGSPILDCNDSPNVSMSDADVSLSLSKLSVLPPSMRLGLHPRVALTMASTPAAPEVARVYQDLTPELPTIWDSRDDTAYRAGIARDARNRAFNTFGGLNSNATQYGTASHSSGGYGNQADAGGSTSHVPTAVGTGLQDTGHANMSSGFDHTVTYRTRGTNSNENNASYHQDLSVVPMSMRLPDEVQSTHNPDLVPGRELESEIDPEDQALPASEFPAARYYTPNEVDGGSNLGPNISGPNATSGRLAPFSTIPTATSGRGNGERQTAFSTVATFAAQAQEPTAAVPIPIPVPNPRAHGMGHVVDHAPRQHVENWQYMGIPGRYAEFIRARNEMRAQALNSGTNTWLPTGNEEGQSGLHEVTASSDALRPIGHGRPRPRSSEGQDSRPVSPQSSVSSGEFMVFKFDP